AGVPSWACPRFGGYAGMPPRRSIARDRLGDAEAARAGGDRRGIGLDPAAAPAAARAAGAGPSAAAARIPSRCAGSGPTQRPTLTREATRGAQPGRSRPRVTQLHQTGRETSRVL